ncbi:chromatin modification-related protein EAF7-domain-containing protein [Pseudomassariella vexata]|uniref:Chromatin modification-related protein EAF7-domain-containing protein n=1 Tax=Pseudomassariella vexata TaxID=1141098 RepID=A0A1Y2E070_9PEZI|nr:chromatin modification-related protein EAF7-domain-containing protein [Pseudomassariella vexata]ORY64887.1 chromatin modification-related protein EAF7-domain-containing protein [Pseudomassariella vexata]
MGPKRKTARGSLAGTSTPNKTPTPRPDDDAMDIDSPAPAETPRAADTPTAAIHNNNPTLEDVTSDPWTDDQTSSLYKGIIRYKPTGMHKHFRIIAISEHLRNHGINAHDNPHTRIPGIWKKLNALYNMDVIDERDNAVDAEDEKIWEKYKAFSLPDEEYYQDEAWRRRFHGPDSVASSPPQIDFSMGSESGRKRKRGADGSSAAGSVAKTRASTVDDTEEDIASSPVTKSARGARSRKRAAVKAKTGSTEPDSDEEEGDEDEENSEPEDAEASSTTKSSRGAAKNKGRARVQTTSTRRSRGRK